MDEKTQSRYETGKAEGYIAAMGEFHRGYETEEIFHEEDPLRVLKRLEAEGWVKHLFAALSSAKANETELEKLRDVQSQLQMQGIHPEAAVANFPFLTAKMAPKEIAALKKSFARQGFVAEIEALEDEAKVFCDGVLQQRCGYAIAGVEAAALGQAGVDLVGWPIPRRMLGYRTSSKASLPSGAQAKQKLPYTLMQEMRIVPELPGYGELLDKLFFELMDGKLGTVEEMKAYLEPYSPPAPPPPVHLRRAPCGKEGCEACQEPEEGCSRSEWQGVGGRCHFGVGRE